LPHDLAALASYRLGFYDEALKHGKDALMHAPNDQRLKNNLFFYKNALSKVDVIIPTKNNMDGLKNLVEQLEQEDKVNRIIVVTDGEEGRETAGILNATVLTPGVHAGSGIHVMWNLGLHLTSPENHVAFINDDVSIEPGTINKLCAALDENPEYGLVSPVYWDGGLDENKHSTTTCRGRYDGTGGIAGFCFVLASDIAQNYRFDEEMKWWYGDDDVVNTVNELGRNSVLVAGTRIVHSHSATIESSPPPAFAETVERDRIYYERKWGNRASGRS
jgi:glycosyltransferase involved in cell wall biosynthesis